MKKLSRRDGHRPKRERIPSDDETMRRAYIRLIRRCFKDLGVDGPAIVSPSHPHFVRTLNIVIDAMKNLSAITDRERTAHHAKIKPARTKSNPEIPRSFLVRLDTILGQKNLLRRFAKR